MNNRKKMTLKYSIHRILLFFRRSRKTRKMRSTRRHRDISGLPMMVRR